MKTRATIRTSSLQMAADLSFLKFQASNLKAETSNLVSELMAQYTIFEGETLMTAERMKRRRAAVKTANAITAIEGVPVSDYAKKRSLLWARGELTSEQMKAALLAFHKRMTEQANNSVNRIK